MPTARSPAPSSSAAPARCATRCCRPTRSGQGRDRLRHVQGMPFQPCFNLQKTSDKSFRGSVSGLGFAYCDFTRRGPVESPTASAQQRDNEQSAGAAAIAALDTLDQPNSTLARQSLRRKDHARRRGVRVKLAARILDVAFRGARRVRPRCRTRPSARTRPVSLVSGRTRFTLISSVV